MRAENKLLAQSLSRSGPRALFVFPNAAGHVNPSLPLCEKLVQSGWQVHYLGVDTFKTAILDTGAIFHDRDSVCAEFGIADLTAMTYKTFEEYNSPGAKMWALNFGSISTEKLLPIYISFFKQQSPQVVVYCPVLSQVAHFAALKLGIPDVSVLTTAGPGFWDAAFASPAAGGATAAGLLTAIKENGPNTRAVESIRAQLGDKGREFSLNTDPGKPVCSDYYTKVNIVTTAASLADTLNSKDAQYYTEAGQSFEFVGPLLGSTEQATVAGAGSSESIAALFQRVDEALAAQQQIVYVSLGTVITSMSDRTNGWEGYSNSGITGQQLCHAVYQSVFNVLGEDGDSLLSPAPLIVVATGPQPDALTGIDVPANAVCLPSVPQVRLLQKARASLAVFITHGGQNSFMESLSVGAPVLVCPGFGDQAANAAKAEAMGVGLKVERPTEQQQQADDADGKAAAVYAAAVEGAIRQVLSTSQHQLYRSKAQAIGADLEKSGGVTKAAQIVQAAAMRSVPVS
jgi:UDP-N-acetylglucosamine:LPS N-acetylglucosamine transferase